MASTLQLTLLRRAASAALRPAVQQQGPAAALALGIGRRAFSDAGAGGGDMGDGSSNITYSGGQATQGQGGFYGAGGARRVTQ
jgi:hypothetical protein